MLVEFDEDQASHREFIVQKQDNVWRLHDYHDYPADGEEQLGKTVTSLLGVSRGALKSRLETDHKRLGVVDPLVDSDDIEGRGQRLTIYRDGDVEKGIKMADLIIGKKVPDQEGEYYVRAPEEKETYIAKLQIDLSTKFSDWVEDDLLKLDRDNLVKLEATSVQQQADGTIVEAVEGSLTREKSADDWALAGINDETEEVDKDGVREMVTQIDNLKLAGIRRRPKSPYADGPIVKNDLKINIPEELLSRPGVRQQAEEDVNVRTLNPIGFLADFDKLRLYSVAGELVASTREGIEYHLNFGKQFKGTEKEIQIGGAKSQQEAPEEKPADGADEKSEDAADKESEDTSDDSESSDKPKTTENRFVFVRVAFNEELLGPAPVEPTEPPKPEVPEGVKTNDALEIIMDGANPWYRERVSTALRLMEDGQKIATALHNTGFDFPDREIVDDLRAYENFETFDTMIETLANDALETSIARVNAQMKIFFNIAIFIFGGVLAWYILGMAGMNAMIGEMAGK